MADKYLFRQVKIGDPRSPRNGRRIDVLVEKGKIARMGKGLNVKAREIDGNGCVLLPGFCDLYADFSDPGFEQREDISTGMAAAAAGGYTTVCVVPNTNPVVQSKASVRYIVNHSAGHAVTVLPLGAVSENLEGRQPTEMYDMEQAGAVGFTDAPHAVRSSGLLLRALQYVQPFGGIIFDMSTDESLANEGHVSEGVTSVKMGLKGIPHMAEVIHLKRNIELLRYSGGRLHIYGVTTKVGTALIRAAKKEGLNLTASVFAHHLVYTDADMSSYDAHLKSLPPFRTETDRKALIKGLQDGVLDCIVSQHTPLEVEEKKKEFEYASPGMTALETTLPLLVRALGKDLESDAIAEWLSIAPRTILGLPEQVLDEGHDANLTLVDLSAEWTYDKAHRRSRSANSPLAGRVLKGRVKGIYHNGKWLANG